jgi:NAD(P)-dependent dehydrogenase (short-subunit alcohol dehydrogenase family)
MRDLTGKVAMVTGGSRGAGKAIGAALAAEGVSVSLVGRTPGDLETAVRAIEASGGRALGLPADIADEAAVDRVMGETVHAFGAVDILINNAGVGARGSVEEIEVARWRRVLDTNLTGAFLCSRAVLPHMRKRGAGWIISISSGAGKQGYPNMAAYCASKFGLMGFSQALAAEVTDANIKVSVICPGTIATGFSSPGQGSTPRPGAKYLLPEDVAEAVVALLKQSDRAWTQEMNLWPFRD